MLNYPLHIVTPHKTGILHINAVKISNLAVSAVLVFVGNGTLRLVSGYAT
jgi:hypothetical protein